MAGSQKYFKVWEYGILGSIFYTSRELFLPEKYIGSTIRQLESLAIESFPRFMLKILFYDGVG